MQGRRSKVQLLAANYHQAGGQAKWLPVVSSIHETSLCMKVVAAPKSFSAYPGCLQDANRCQEDSHLWASLTVSHSKRAYFWGEWCVGQNLKQQEARRMFFDFTVNLSRPEPLQVSAPHLRRLCAYEKSLWEGAQRLAKHICVAPQPPKIVVWFSSYRRDFLINQEPNYESSGCCHWGTDTYLSRCCTSPKP